MSEKPKKSNIVESGNGLIAIVIIAITLMLLGGAVLLSLMVGQEPDDLPRPTAEVYYTYLTADTPVPLIPTETLQPVLTEEPTLHPDNVALMLVIISEEADDGLKLRTSPGYECDSISAPDCNWVDTAYPATIDELPDRLYPLLGVDASFEPAWCNYTIHGGDFWSACEYLQPATQDACLTARKLDIEQFLASCGGES